MEGRYSKVKNIQEDEYDKCCLACKRPSDLQVTKPLNEWFVYFDVTWQLLLGTDIMLTIAVPKPSNILTWFQLGSNRCKTSGNGIFPSHNTCVHGNDRMELKFKKKISNLDKTTWAPPPPHPICQDLPVHTPWRWSHSCTLPKSIKVFLHFILLQSC